jgi:site-specific recombinase XerD
MPKLDLPTLPKLLHAFFYEWLVEQRNASHRTVLAYRDAWRLFLRFVAQHRNKPVAALDLEHLTGAEVLAFLQHIEQERRATVNTRNCRLAALRSFFSFVAEYEPRAAKQCAEVLRVPFKRTTRRAIRYLDSAEVSAILSQPDRNTVGGQRDHALMSLLYNTGARIQEALDLRPQDIHLKSPAHVRLMGKGRKERISPIWPETAALITALTQRQPRKPDEPLFVNRYRSPLTASGFRFRLRQYVKAAAEGVPTISKKRVTPHLFRHYLPFRTMSCNGTCLRFGSMILGPIMQSPRQFARHSLVPAPDCPGREKAAGGGHSDRPFQSCWNRKNVAGAPFGTSRENCFVVDDKS